MLHYISAYNLSLALKICGLSKTTKINATEQYGNLHVHTVYTEGYVMLSTTLTANHVISPPNSPCPILFLISKSAREIAQPSRNQIKTLLYITS